MTECEKCLISGQPLLPAVVGHRAEPQGLKTHPFYVLLFHIVGKPVMTSLLLNFCRGVSMWLVCLEIQGQIP